MSGVLESYREIPIVSNEHGQIFWGLGQITSLTPFGKLFRSSDLLRAPAPVVRPCMFGHSKATFIPFFTGFISGRKTNG
jgi:hypothetical protein